MPRIFDNIEQKLLPTLQETLAVSERADFCVGYFNLRGWKQIDSYIERFAGGETSCCRLLVGMHRTPQEELREALHIARTENGIDNQTAIRFKKKLAEEFRNQLTIGAPSNEDEAGLRRLAAQIKAKKVKVKLFLQHPLHAKLYLLFRDDHINPIIGYLGSSNLTFSGLSYQGELNVDVLDYDTCQKLSRWFEDRWNNRWCVDISDDLVQIIEESWAREDLIPPYHIYVKMAYHLSQEARAGLAEFRIPREFDKKLFEFQKAAVKIAAHYLNKRGGVLIGDVVGLGKTLMATALARVLEEDFLYSTLIICPKNLVKMWQSYVERYGLRAKVLSLSRVVQELPNVPARFRLVLIDESHNLRNREGKRYRAIQEYIAESESKCILLSATPYNKTYTDLSNQLKLFIPDEKNLGIRPERLLRQMGEAEFNQLHQISLHSLAAFEKSPYADDWRELMRLYMVRRTRSFIQENYADTDPQTNRRFLTFSDGSRSYFPVRHPKTKQFVIDENDPDDKYARLYSDAVVKIINELNLPRYGLGNYVSTSPQEPPSPAEARLIQNLSIAGKRLMGFCRTNLFKRLESSGKAFLLSLERHVLRNYIFLHAIQNGKPLPIGTQDAALLDTRFSDMDSEAMSAAQDLFTSDAEEESANVDAAISQPSLRNEKTEQDFELRAEEVYQLYETEFKNRFKWIRSNLFIKALEKDIRKDARALFSVLQMAGEWKAEKDAKLTTLLDLLAQQHPTDKILIFSQFADTVHYLESCLKAFGVPAVAGVTGGSSDPTGLAWRFSPVSNEKQNEIEPQDELRVLVATDILSEGQNLQDCSIVVNYDLPWAIIRLIQRAGRVDRIGQQAEQILCYTFLPAEGVNRIIKLRERVRQRLNENAEVVGTDEAFFEDDKNDQIIIDIYNENAGVLDGDADTEVDLASYAYQIWKNAITDNPSLQKAIPALPDVGYSTRPFVTSSKEPEGVLVYMRTAEGTDALAWMDQQGNSVTESQFAILRAAECTPNTPALPRRENHHRLVHKAVELILEEERAVGGQLGRPSGARFRTYTRLKRYAEEIKGTLFESPDLLKALDQIYRYPLRQAAIDTLNRQLKSGISDDKLAELVIALRDEDRLCVINEEERTYEPQIICSLGLVKE